MRMVSKVFALGLFLFLAVHPHPARAQMAVFDAASYGQLVQELDQGAQQLTQLQQQLQTQLRMVQSLPSDVMTGMGITQLAQDTQSLMSSVQGIQDMGSSLQGTMNTLYPSDWSNLTTAQQVIAQLASMQATTKGAYQQSMAMQNMVAQHQAQLQAAVAAADGESMAAAGPLGAIQASNQILGTMSQQLADQEDTISTAYRAAEQKQLEQDSQDAAGDQMVKNADTPLTDTGPTMSNPFPSTPVNP